MMAIGWRVSLATRMLSSTITCPVLVRTAVCSTAHSSGASRLALEQRATQPGGAGALAGAASACGAGVGDGVAWAARGAALALGACGVWPKPGEANVTATTNASAC